MTTIEMRVQSMQSEFSKSEQKVAAYFLKNKENIFRYPLAKLSEMSHASQGAWIRFCKAVGYNGLKGLKNALFLEMNNTISETEEGTEPFQFTDIKEQLPLDSLAQHIYSTSIQALESTIKLLDLNVVQTVIEKVIHAGAISFFGIGASGMVAYDMYCKLLRIGYNVRYSQDYHVSLTYAATSKPGDVAFIYSNSGETREMLHAVDILNETGATTIGITKYSSNTLSQKASHVLYISSPEIYMRSGAMSSRLAQLCLNDILFTAIANRDYPNIEHNLQQSYQSCHYTTL